jgi:mannosyltransferase
MFKSSLSLAIGIFLILSGSLLPSTTLVEFLRGTSKDSLGQLLLGAKLFRTCLVILGILIILLVRAFQGKSEIKSEKSFLEPHRKSIRVILVGILLAASALYLYRLGDGLWFDEIVTVVKYVRVPLGEIISTYDTNHHTLYNVLAHISIGIFGDNPWSLRFPAVLFGIGSIWVLYLLARQVGSAEEGVFSAALLAFSYQHVWFSQNARGYTGLLFWTLLASWLLLRALRERRPLLWLLYATTVALGAYTLVYMLFVVIGHFVIYLMTLFGRRNEIGPHKWMGFWLGFFLAALFTLLLYSFSLPQIFTTFAEANVTGMPWKKPLWSILEFVRGMQMNFSGGIMIIVALVIFGAGFVNFARTNSILIQLLIIPAVLCMLVKLGMGHHLWPRSVYFAVGFGAIVVVRGAKRLGYVTGQRLHLSSTKSVLLGRALCVGLILFSAASIRFAYGPKQDYQGALAFVERSREPGDAVVTVGLATFPYKYFYKVDWKEADTLGTLDFIRSGAKRTWLLYTLPFQLQDEYPEIAKCIEQRYKTVKEFYGTLNGGTIYVCLSKDPDS